MAALETIVSDESWRVAPGPITFSCIFGGEDYDARQEPAGWDLPGFGGEGWKKAAITAGPGGTLCPAECAAGHGDENL